MMVYPTRIPYVFIVTIVLITEYAMKLRLDWLNAGNDTSIPRSNLVHPYTDFDKSTLLNNEMS